VKVRGEMSAREIELTHETLQRRLGDTSIPTLPQVAMKIIELVSDQDATIQDFAEVIKTDQGLTGRLLRMVNSAAFGQRKPVTQIERAMILLGLEKLKAITLGFHLSRAAASDDGDYSFKRLWTQSLYRGWLGLRIAEQINNDISGEAFVVGLMGDAGVPMMPKLVGPTYADTAPIRQTPAKHHQDELQNLPFTHLDLAAVLARMWKLPEILAKPMANHHARPAAMNPKDPASVLNAVAYFICSIPLDTNGEAEITNSLQTVSERLLGIPAAKMREYVAGAGEDLKACKAMFSHLIDSELAIENILDEANRNLEDEMTEQPAAAAPSCPATRVEAGGFVLEMEADDAKGVTVFIMDSQGNRLLSEHIDPQKQSESEIRDILMLTDASEDEVQTVMNGISGLAAAA
jgi:HD-like signal output (HDOD) protein